MKTQLQRIGIALLIVCFSTNVKSQVMDCLTFDGNDDYLVAENIALNNIETGDFTFEAWIKGEESIQIEHPTIFSNRPDEESGTIFFFHGVWNNSHSKMLAVQLEGVNYFVFNNGTHNASMLDDECHHVAITRNNSLLTFYFDGIPIGTRVITNGNPTVASANYLFIGEDPAILHAFNGTLSQIRIWDYARSQSDIQNNMNISITPPINGLVSYWEMNEGSGEIIFDKTGMANAQRGSTNNPDINDPSWSSNCCLGTLSSPDEQTPRFSIFPNPTKKHLHIDLRTTYSNIKMAIVDLNGKVIILKQFYSKSYLEMNLEILTKGIYFVKIIADGQEQVHKIIKK